MTDPQLRTLGECTWPEVAGDTRLLLVPVGSLEQHGPHLPLDTDTVIAQAVAARVAGRLAGRGVAAWVAPPVVFGSSGEHQSFAGTISIGTEVLHRLVVELVRSARTWVERVVLVNAHGGNARALDLAVSQLVAEGHDVAWVPCTAQGEDLHAGCTETSLMLYLCPASVRLDRAVPGDSRALSEILPTMIAGGVAAVSPTGVLGDPRGATAAHGAKLVEMMTEHVATAALLPHAVSAR